MFEVETKRTEGWTDSRSPYTYMCLSFKFYLQSKHLGDSYDGVGYEMDMEMLIDID